MSRPSGRTFFRLLLLAGLILMGIALIRPVESAERRTERLVMSAPDTVVISGDDAATLSVTLKLASGWHINTNNPIQDYLIPTRLTLSDTPPEVRDVKYPTGETYSFAFSQEELRVYSDTTILEVTVHPTDSPVGVLDREWELTFQPCSDRQCLRPKTMRLPVRFQRVDAPR